MIANGRAAQRDDQIRAGSFCGQLCEGFRCVGEDAEVVRFYLEQSFSFHVATPEAAVPLKP